MTSRSLGVVGGLGAAGLLTLGYASLIERNLFTLRRYDVPVLPAGTTPLRVLHLSDIHLTVPQKRKAAWVRSLAELRPDFVVNTGDSLAGADAIPAVVDALEPLLQLPGAFVWGNNDYYAPVPKSPHHYFVHKRGTRPKGRRIDLGPLETAFTEAGWIDLDNTRAETEIAGVRTALAGVDDPHLRRDRYTMIADAADASAALRVGLLHSPEPRLLDRFVADGYDLLLAGHTHGGQVCVPGYGAIVTNCGIDRARASGLSTWTTQAGRTAYLHVSAGLGTSPYAPVRVACRPEATLLTLVPAALIPGVHTPSPYADALP